VLAFGIGRRLAQPRSDGAIHISVNQQGGRPVRVSISEHGVLQPARRGHGAGLRQRRRRLQTAETAGGNCKTLTYTYSVESDLDSIEHEVAELSAQVGLQISLFPH
jgi:hypothetical protein